MEQQPFLLNLPNIVIGLQNDLFCSHTNCYGQTDIITMLGPILYRVCINNKLGKSLF